MTGEARSRELKRLLRDGLLVCDGAVGTSLSAAGHGAGRSLELMNVEEPDRVRAVHRAYLGVGADVVETNTFQGSRPALERHGVGERTVELNEAAAALAREATDGKAWIAGSIGPTGRILEPYGDYSQEAARVAFAEQAGALARNRVDFLIVETLSAIEEARIAVEEAVRTGLPVAASMAFDPNGHTAFGVTPRRAAQELASAGAMVVGANCGTISPAEMVDILREFREASDLPLIAQPNAGRPERGEEGPVYRQKPDETAEAAVRFRELGATVIGGCCGTTPEHIRAIAQRLRQR